MKGNATCSNKNSFSFHHASIFILLLITQLTFCSLNYDQQVNSESSVPEFIFSKATFNRYENDALTMELEALQLEQYKNDGPSYAENVKFKTWNNDRTVDTEGSCGLLSANTQTKIYTLFTDIIIKNNTQKVQIYADNLKWDSNTEQLTSGATDKVTLKRDDVELEGSGFSASGVSRSFSFTQPVSGTITTGESSQPTTTGAAQ